MSELARIIEYYPEYAVPEMYGAMFIDRQWFDSFLRNCNDDNVAIVAMCWFTGTREVLDRTGAFDEWKSVPAATWGEYKLAANEVAKHQLLKLPATGAVFIESATPATWWRVQQEGRKWDTRLDRSHQIAHYDGNQIVLESRIAAPANIPVQGQFSWWNVVRLLITLPIAITFLVKACSGDGT